MVTALACSRFAEASFLRFFLAFSLLDLAEMARSSFASPR